jgi:hypothetical protein
MIKSRRMRWVGHVVRMGEMRNEYKILIGKPEESNHSEDLDVDGTILKLISGIYGWRVWIRFMWLRIGTGGGFL